MRVAPINLASRRNFQPQKNLNFGKIEEENRQRIIDALPTVEGIDKQDTLERKGRQVAAIDHNNGVMVKWGGKGHPRGLIYADLIREHVDKSFMKESYLEMTREYWGNKSAMAETFSCLDNIEKPKTYKMFMSSINAINSYEALGEDSLKVPSSSISDNSSEQEEREDNFIYGMFNRPL